ncbi:hypothetical protein [Streptomyces sp. NPDC054849]
MAYDSRPGTPGGGQGSPVHVTLPRRDPEPAPGCPEGAGAAMRRAGDMSGVSDCNVDVRSHPHARDGGAR